jgi:hypothetical protein
MTRISTETIDAALRKARDMFCQRDLLLIKYDVNERSMTSKLGAYIQESLRDYEVDVDCEYNRVGNERAIAKVLPRRFFEPVDDPFKTKTIYPDIIVHRRGQSQSNYVVIEAKKSRNDQDIDELKLAVIASAHGYRYDHAVLLTFLDEPPYISWRELSLGRIDELLAANDKNP